MTELALLIITSAGFGRHIPLSAFSSSSSSSTAPAAPSTANGTPKAPAPTATATATASSDLSLPPPGFTLPFVPALLAAVRGMNLQSLMRQYPLVAHLPLAEVRRVKTAYAELREYLRGMVEVTRAEMRAEGFHPHALSHSRSRDHEAGAGAEVEADSAEPEPELGEQRAPGTGARIGRAGKGAKAKGAGGEEADLFKLLIRANEEEEGREKKLSDDELLSTTYVFLLAGHETTANTLAFACALLALNPRVQAALRAEADAVFPHLRAPEDALASYREDMPRLKYAEATFRETLRLFPAEVRLTKRAARDTTLRGTVLSTGEKYDVPVPKGTIVWLDVWAVHTMTEWWGADADEFRPERFFDTDDYKWPRDAYMPFSLGARSCIGARFATLEGMVILSHLVREYEICLTPEMEALPLEERKRQMLSWSIGVAIQATGAKVLLKKRARV
ncbi:cytochrome P450 [Calocera cornea HHB12733]|uniref:Cytochrome P450 n=1 Tax=Calocera cornea HHB12733 TaxID=1353952 RepID=A0A165C9M5_9BASI|nr:cytochrome P450 [Calocera cornea HHB12733]